MTVEIIKNGEVQISNNKLRNFTEQIFKQGLNVKKAFAKVANILVKIDETKCYEQDGFESVQDYALQVFGWKQATTYAMLRIGRDYIDGKTLESVLPHEAENDYSNSQLQALLPLKSVDTAKALAERHIISPEMTVKEIKKVVKDYKGGNSKDEGETEGSKIEESSNGESESVKVNSWTILHTFDVMQDTEGKVIFICDSEELEKTALIEMLEKF